MIHPPPERHGVKDLLHKPTGIQVVHPKFDVFNLFLLDGRRVAVIPPLCETGV